jgi:hypothetical protein
MESGGLEVGKLRLSVALRQMKKLGTGAEDQEIFLIDDTTVRPNTSTLYQTHLAMPRT